MSGREAANIVGADAFWPMMNIVRHHAKVFSQGIYIDGLSGRNGARLFYTNQHRLAVVRDAMAEVSRRGLFVPRPKVRLPQMGWALKSRDVVGIEEAGDQLRLTYKDHRGQDCEATVTPLRGLAARIPNWTPLVVGAEVAPISVLKEAREKGEYNIIAHSIRTYRASFGHSLQQFVLQTSTFPVWAAIDRYRDILVLETPVPGNEPPNWPKERPPSHHKPKADYYDFRNLPELSGGEMRSVKNRILDLVNGVTNG